MRKNGEADPKDQNLTGPCKKVVKLRKRYSWGPTRWLVASITKASAQTTTKFT